MTSDRLSYFGNKVYILNWLMTVLVVMIHGNPMGYYGLDEKDYILIKVFSRMAELAVPMFFFMSSFLFYRNCSYSSLSDKLKRRLKSLVIPYFLWNAIFVFVFLVILNIPQLSVFLNMGTDALNTPYKVFDAILNSRLTPLWFVKFLIIFTLFSPLLLWVLQRKALSVLFLTVLILISIGVEFELIPYHVDYPHLNIFRWFPCYFMGAIWAYNIRQSQRDVDYSLQLLSRTGQNRVGLFCLACLALLIYVSCRSETYLQFYRLFAPLLVWNAFDCFLYKSLFNRSIRHFNYTFFIYCSHYFVINVIMKFVVRVVHPSSIAVYGLYFAVPLFVIIILFLCARSISNTSAYKLLSGGR